MSPKFILLACLGLPGLMVFQTTPTPSQEPGKTTSPPVSPKGEVKQNQTDSPPKPAGAPKTDPTPARISPVPDTSPDTTRMVEWDKIKGKWSSVQFEYEGQVYPSEGRWNLIFEKDAISWTGFVPAQVLWSGTIQLDGTPRPREITLVIKSLTSFRLQKGIYTIDGDNLAICWATGFDGERPDKFETYDQPRRLLVRMKRVKEETPK